VSNVQPVPDPIALITGDAIQNMMSALDHLAYQLVCASTNDNPPNPNWIYFPIQDDATKYEAKKLGKIQGAQQAVIDAIDAIKPYKGGNDLLWTLYRLNNVEKHRLLFTVGSMFQSVNIGAHMQALMQKVWDQPDSPFKGKTVPILDLFLKPADVLFPLKIGDELFIDAPDAEVNEKMQFRFGVALSEPQIVQAQSLMELLIQLTGLVEGIISALKSELV
ncbi:MAG: hypothetical protein WCA20_38800, partial [Candidatus Sulfotelmatobacter sp.]